MKKCLLFKKKKKQTYHQPLNIKKIPSQHQQPTGVGWKLTRGSSLVGGHTEDNGDYGVFFCVY